MHGCFHRQKRGGGLDSGCARRARTGCRVSARVQENGIMIVNASTGAVGKSSFWKIPARDFGSAG
jgi:hypothetical protein